MNYYSPLEPGTYYHIFSRAVGDERLFRREDNYSFFLQKYRQYINPIADTFAYCLLPNHFHFLIKIKDEDSLILEDKSLGRDLMQCFSNFLNSYTKSFNKYFKRRGSLFMDYMRRAEVKDNEQLYATLFYIHKNPVHHGCCEKMERWKWSSYSAFFSTAPTLLKREEVLLWFYNLEGFKEFHSQEILLKKAVEVE